MNERITESDKTAILKLFGKPLGEMTVESFKDLQKAARKKYHPDNFTHYEDELVQEMAKERFQQIEVLSKKIQEYFEVQGDLAPRETEEDEVQHVGYVADGIHIDIMTRDMQLKYRLFSQRIIYRGDKIKIPGTQARLTALEDYSPRASAGFRDNIKVRLTFEANDNVQTIVHWIFQHISGVTSSFVIESKVVKITPVEILQAIKKEARYELGA
ncbi:MAG: J domain-containing protein [Bacteroidota bacterium]